MDDIDQMDPSANWLKLDDRQYKFLQFNAVSGELKLLDFHHSRVAVAKWGGPIAATKNTEKIVLMKSEDIVRDCICFFSNNGKLINKVPYKDLEKVVLFDFIEDELLIVLKQDGHYYLIDPLKGTKKIYDLGDTFRKSSIINAQVCANGFVLMREHQGQIEFQYIPNVYQPQLTKMISPDIIAPPDHWIAIPPNSSFSRKVEVQLTHPEAGIILLVEDEMRKVYYNKEKQENSDKTIIHLPQIKMISASTSYKFFSYLSFYQGQWIHNVMSDDFKQQKNKQIILDLTESDNVKQDGPIKDKSIIERPKRMLWCGDDCAVIQLTYYLILIGPLSSERIKQTSKNFVLFTELDGLRLISQKSNEILRRIPDSFINVFKPCSTESGALLNSAYGFFEQGAPIEDDELRSNKNELSQGVLDCIQAGQYEINLEHQTKLLKAASYGKTFLGNQGIDFNSLNNVCRHLRVQNTLKRNGSLGGRSLTYDQVDDLHKNEGLFVKLMLRYNQHYMAHEVSKYLKFSIKFKSQIYTHWACCKVEVAEDDEILCLLIKEKLKEEKGVSFTEIAHRAIEVGKINLALKLLDNEPSLAKRVPVLLGMAAYQQGGSTSNYYQKALEDALKSRDSNLIFLVIMKFLKGPGLDEAQTFIQLSQNSIIQSHLIIYLKGFDELGLQRYYSQTKRLEECALLAIQQSYKRNNLPERIKLLEQAKQYFHEQSKENFYIKIVSDQIEILHDLQNGGKNKKKKTLQEKPLNDILETFLKNDDMKVAQEFAKQYKIPDRRFNLTRAKTLIAKKNFDELDNLLSEKNKKSVLIPYEIVADLMIRSGEEDKGLQILLKMPDVEEQVDLLMKIGQFRYAAKAAMDKKNIQLVHEVRGAIQDPAIIAFIDLYLSKNEKK